MTDKSMENRKLTAASESLGNGDSLNISNQSDEFDDPELQMIKARVKEIQEQAKRIEQLQNDLDKMADNAPAHLSLSIEEKMSIDARSIYVGNVDYGATPEELEAHFQVCGSINRVSIQCDKFSSHSKGFAYIEFADQDSVSTSTALDESWFKDRQIKVLPKRTNCPGISSTNRPPRRFHRPSRPHFSGYRRVRRSFRRRSWYYPY